jgi:hypothetical protein
MTVGRLVFIHQEVISTSTSSVDITNVFSSRYDVYKITATDFSTVGTAAVGINARYINSSGTVLSSNYDSANLTLADNATFVENRTTTGTAANIFGAFDQLPDSFGSVAYVFNPFDTNYTFAIATESRSDEQIFRGGKSISVLKSTDSITGFRAIETTGTRPFDTGKITVYGVL